MKKVLLQAKVLAETIVESEVFQKMHNAELALSQNSDANLAIMKVMEKRKITDTGKLRALRDAGWTIRKIAREFIVTEAEVKRALKQEGML